MSFQITERDFLLALHGKQSLADDNLGMVILYRNKDLIKITEDEHSHVVVLKPMDGKLIYYFGAVWEQEQDGIQSKETFQIYLDQIITRFNIPLVVEL